MGWILNTIFNIYDFSPQLKTHKCINYRTNFLYDYYLREYKCSVCKSWMVVYLKKKIQ